MSCANEGGNAGELQKRGDDPENGHGDDGEDGAEGDRRDGEGRVGTVIAGHDGAGGHHRERRLNQEDLVGLGGHVEEKAGEEGYQGTDEQSSGEHQDQIPLQLEGGQTEVGQPHAYVDDGQRGSDGPEGGGGGFDEGWHGQRKVDDYDADEKADQGRRQESFEGGPAEDGRRSSRRVQAHQVVAESPETDGVEEKIRYDVRQSPIPEEGQVYGHAQKHGVGEGEGDAKDAPAGSGHAGELVDDRRHEEGQGDGYGRHPGVSDKTGELVSGQISDGDRKKIQGQGESDHQNRQKISDLFAGQAPANEIKAQKSHHQQG